MMRISVSLFICLILLASGSVSVFAETGVKSQYAVEGNEPADMSAMSFCSFESSSIKSAEYIDVKVPLNDNSMLLLNSQPVSLLREIDYIRDLYLPVEDTLKALGYGVTWNEDDKTVELTAVPEESAEFKVFLEHDVIPLDAESITIILHNPTNCVVTNGKSVQLEKEEYGEWKKVSPLPDNYFWNARGSVPTKSLYKGPVYIKRLFGSLEPGRYRILKTYLMHDIFEGIYIGEKEFILEFEVREVMSDNIVSAETEDIEISLDGAPVALDEAFVSVQKEGEANAVLYMQWNELLSHLGLEVYLNKEENVIELQSGEKINTDVAMLIYEDNITVNTEDIKLIITFFTESGYIDVLEDAIPGTSLMDGSAFFLEKKINEDWTEIPEQTEEGLRSSSGSTDSAKVGHYNINLQKHYGQLTPGSYRLVKSYCTLYLETFYCAEFEVYPCM